MMAWAVVRRFPVFAMKNFLRKIRGGQMKGKGITVVAAAVLCGMLMTGCSGAKETAADAGVTPESAQNEKTPDDGGVVSLTIWAEETNHEVLGKMAESFKQEYAG